MVPRPFIKLFFICFQCVSKTMNIFIYFYSFVYFYLTLGNINHNLIGQRLITVVRFDTLQSYAFVKALVLRA